MKDFLKLIQNELIKIYRQISWKILTIFALVIAVGYPVLKLAYENVSSSYYADYQSIADSVDDSYLKKYYLSQAEAAKYFTEKGLNRTTWQYELYYYEYLNINAELTAMDLLIADKEMSNIVDVMEAFRIDGVERVWEGDKETNKYTYRERIYDNNTGQTTYGEEVDFTPEIARRLKQKFTSEKTKLEKQISAKFSTYLSEKFKDYKKRYQDAQNRFDSAEKLYNVDKSVISDYQTAKMQAEGLKAILQVQPKLTYLDNLTNAQQTAVIRTLSSLENVIVNYASEYAAASKEDFDELGMIYYRGARYEDYNEYLKAAQRQQDIYYQAVNQYCYSLSNNIPVPSTDQTSTRRRLADALSINTTIVMFLAVFLSAVIVASEHTSGAIRLLMIRPRARWKILLSKLMCVITYSLGLTITASLLTTLTEIIIYGWNDLSVPYLLMNGAAVSEVAPISYYIYQNLTVALPSVFAACVAFFLSVLAKRSVAALAVSMLINVFGSVVCQSSYRFIQEAEWLKLTPVPYFLLRDAFPEPMSMCIDWWSPHNYGLSFNIGIIVLLIYSFIMLILSFVIFNKEQIKN